MTLSLIQSLDDAAVIALVPGVVALLRKAGVPERYGPLCAVASAIVLVILADLASNGDAVTIARTAAWLLTGLIDGLAAAGLTRVAYPLASGPARATESTRRSKDVRRYS